MPLDHLVGHAINVFPKLYAADLARQYQAPLLAVLYPLLSLAPEEAPLSLRQQCVLQVGQFLAVLGEGRRYLIFPCCGMT